MPKSNKTLSRILIGSAIGAVVGLVLLIMGIAVVLNALEGRSNPKSEGLEVELHDPDPDREADRPWGALPDDERWRGYDDRYEPGQDRYGEADPYGEADAYRDDHDRYDYDDDDRDDEDDRDRDREREAQKDRDRHSDRDDRDRDRDRREDRRDRDEGSRSDRSTYPRLDAPAPPITVPRRAEPLPPQSRSQWRSIFEDEAPRPPQARPAEPAPRATTPAPAPRTQAAPSARPAPRPSQPRAAPEAKKDEESLFY